MWIATFRGFVQHVLYKTFHKMLVILKTFYFKRFKPFQIVHVA